MTKNITTKFCLLLIAITAIIACEKEKQDNYPEIRFGKEDAMTELYLNKLTEKRIILTGGNGKYTVNVENSRIASANMSIDTLKVKGILEGETFLTVISHDKRARLKINVTYPDLGVSHTTINLLPGLRNKMVSISGGGERTRIEENDPSDVVDVKWDGSSGMLEINPKYEGVAEITAVSEDDKDKKIIRINVKPDGDLENIGAYTTTSTTYYPVVNNKMMVKRKGVATWVFNSGRPFGGNIGGTFPGTLLKFAPVVNPTKGESADIRILDYVWGQKKELEIGTYPVYVEEVREATSEVVLLGKGFKFLLPYEK